MAPHNTEAEEAALGSLLIDPDAIFKVASFLAPEDFYREKNGWIYDAIRDLHNRREPADFVTLCDELERRGQLEEVGGAAYITFLINAVPTAIHAEYYARIVERTAILRRLISAAGQIAAIAYEDAEDVDEVVDRAEQVLFGVSQRRIVRDLVPIKQIIGVYYDRIDYLYQHRGELIGTPTGFPLLDKLLGGLQPSDLIIVAGRPSMGKTSFALSVAQNAARKFNQRVALFSLEMSSEQVVQRLISAETGIDSQRLRLGDLKENEWPLFVEATGILSEVPVFVDDTPSISALQMRTKARRLHAEHGLDLIIVDYLQLMRGDTRAENRVQEISSISRALKGLARELNLPVVAVSQLSRAVEARKDHRPILSDLRESGCLTGDTLIQLTDGRRVPICQLAEHNGSVSVMALNETTWQLEPTMARKAWHTGNKPVFHLKTQLGHGIRATANHKFRTVTGWKRLDQLEVGEHIALPRSWESLPEQNPTMTEPEVALLGHLLGDGCTLPRHAVQYTTSERDLANIVAELATTIFGDTVRPRIERQYNWWQVYLSANEHLTHNTRNPIAEWLDDLGVWGYRSYEKRVPEKLFRQPEALIYQFLRHLWTTDGTLGVTGRKKPRAMIYYTTSSQELARDIQHLLRRVRIVARMRRVPQGDKGRDQWHVIITGKPDVMKFIEKIGVVGPKIARLEAIREFYRDRNHNTNRDVIPKAVWRSLVEPARKALSMSQRAMQAALGMQYCGSTLYKANMSRERALRVAQVVQSDALLRLAMSDIYWDRVAEIESVGVEDVYDLEVPEHHNFVAEDIVIHNSIEQDADVVMFIYREEIYDPDTELKNIADIIVAKHRNGPTGKVPLFFKTELAQFHEVEFLREELGP
jgi:replicative DNA helicase